MGVVDMPTELLVKIVATVPGQDIAALQRSATVFNRVVKSHLDLINKIAAEHRSVTIEWGRKALFVNESTKTLKNFTKIYIVEGAVQVCREERQIVAFEAREEDIWTIVIRIWITVVGRLETRELRVKGLKDMEALELIRRVPPGIMKKLSLEDMGIRARTLHEILEIVKDLEELEIRAQVLEEAEKRWPVMKKLKSLRAVAEELEAAIDDEWLLRSKSLKNMKAPTVVSLNGLRKLIEQWKEKEREVEEFSIGCKKSREERRSREQALAAFHDCEVACASRRYRDGHFVLRRKDNASLEVAFFQLPNYWRLDLKKRI